MKKLNIQGQGKNGTANQNRGQKNGGPSISRVANRALAHTGKQSYSNTYSNSNSSSYSYSNSDTDSDTESDSDSDSGSDKEGLQSLENEGFEVEVPEFKPVGPQTKFTKRRENQERQLEQLGMKLDQMTENPDKIARSVSGNSAPPVPLQTVHEWMQAFAQSSAYPGTVYDALYRSGIILRAKQEAEDLANEGRTLPRLATLLSEEELEAVKAQFIVPRGSHVELPEWDPGMFPMDGTMVLFGKRRSGKSWLVREVLSRYRLHYRQVIVLTNTQQNDFWPAHVPFRFIHKYDPFVVSKILDHQKAILAWNELNADNPGAIVNPFMAIVLDDVVSKDMHHDPLLNELFYEGRHSDISIFITTQHPKALPPGVRANADAAIIFPMRSSHDEEAIRDQYCNFFEDKMDFRRTLIEYTHDHACLVVFLADTSALPIEQLYTYRSKDPGPFVCCAAEYWKGDADHKKAFYEAWAAKLNMTVGNNGPEQKGSPASGFQFLVNDSETDSLIQELTF